MEKGTCRLCLHHKSLCKSHVIPEFLYRSIYNSEHRMWLINTEHEDRLGAARSGIWEPLLCEDCERKLRDLEDYASRVIYGPEPLQVLEYPGLLIYNGIDYRKFKLFQLSILWRMGVAHSKVNSGTTALNRFFEPVKLGPHEEILRRMLVEENPGSVPDYGCIMSAVTYKDRVADDMLLQPEHHRVDGLNGYRFSIGGFVIWFMVSKEAARFPRKEFFLQEDGTLRVDIGDVHNFGFIKNALLSFQPTVRRNIHRVIPEA